MKRTITILLAVILLITSLLSLCACGDTTNSTADNETAVAEVNDTDETAETEEQKVTDNPIATITMADGGVITIELYPDTAPNTVKNFISLANDGFYDGLIFHRVIPGFMIQGGDPLGSGMGGPGYSIQGEFALNGIKNTLKHNRGVISMARSSAYDSAGSQFFIMVDTASYLDGSYAAFGCVTDGMDVVDQIVSVDTDSNDKPYEDQVIKTIRVDTKGIDYSEPETLPE